MLRADFIPVYFLVHHAGPTPRPGVPPIRRAEDRPISR